MTHEHAAWADVGTVDWHSLSHAHGPATDMPKLWKRFLTFGDPEGTFSNTVCHQGTVYPATRALVPFLIMLAKSDDPRAMDAVLLLGCIVRSGGGVLEDRQRLATRRPVNPFTGQQIVMTPPDPEALAAERRWVSEMKRAIAAETPRWRALAQSQDAEVAEAAHYLLTGVAR